MADLSPDTSIYRPFAEQGTPDPGRLMNLIGGMRALQTQSAVSDALKQSGGDPNAALTTLLQPGGPGFINPETVEHLSKLGQFYSEQSANAVSALYGQAKSNKGANSSDLDRASSYLAGFHVPPAEIMEMRRRVQRLDGSVDPDALLQYWNIAHPGTPIPMQQVQTAGGVVGQMPATAAQVNAGPGGFVPTSIPGAEQPALGGVHDFLADTRAAQTFNSDVNPLVHILKGIQSGVMTGRGTEELTNFGNFAHTFGLDKLFGEDIGGKVASYEQVRKYMIRGADQASGGQTDARFIAAVSGNPNAKLETLTNEQLGMVNLGLRRMQQIGYQEFNREMASGALFQGHPLTIQDYGRWYAQWAPKQDVRAFVHDFYSDKQKHSIMDEMNKGADPKGQMDAYMASLKAMQNHPEIMRAGQ